MFVVISAHQRPHVRFSSRIRADVTGMQGSKACELRGRRLRDYEQALQDNENEHLTHLILHQENLECDLRMVLGFSGCLQRHGGGGGTQLVLK